MYGSARKSYLQMLDHIHNQGLGLCFGAFKPPVESLYVDAHESSLCARQENLSLQYTSMIKLLPTHDAEFHNKYRKLFDARPNTISIIGLRIKQLYHHGVSNQ